MARSRVLTVWLPVLAWAAVIFTFSSIPSLSSGLGVWDTVLRKGAHLTEYAVLGGLLYRALEREAPALAAGMRRRSTWRSTPRASPSGCSSGCGCASGESGRRRPGRIRRRRAALAGLARGCRAALPCRRVRPRAGAAELAAATRALRGGTRSGLLPTRRRGDGRTAPPAGGRHSHRRLHRRSGGTGAGCALAPRRGRSRPARRGGQRGARTAVATARA